ncbi:MAG: peptide ABC transporter substrate-binding protein, partial [Candidatus Saccharibacteria bacterium]|nr:peptide ABC transporter substrate-binding protein [Pseudorhodobacter sp.]
MSNEFNHILKLAAAGKMSRRGFIGRAGALGVSAAMAGTLLATVARAEDAPVKGGVIRAGVQGGQSTDTLDPALAASPAPFLINSTWGETLVEVSGTNEITKRLAEDYSSNADASQGMFKIRKGVKFHDGTEMTPADVVATLKRHTDGASKSGALGIVKGISDMTVDGDTVTLTMASPNADLPYLMADYHLVIQPGGGVANPTAAIGTGPYKISSFDPGVRCAFERHADYWDTTRGFADSVEILVINDNTAR